MTAIATPRAAGRVTLVGAGPGDADLLTVRAVKALRRATVALVDDLVDPGVLRYLRRGARVVPVGKRGGCVSTPQVFIHRLMVAEARAGEQVVRLKGGDPFVFGRGGEEAAALRAAGIEVDVVSGLTAGIAGPAAIGIPVTDRRHAPGVALVTGHAKPGGAGPDWAALARSGLTLVVYMGTRRVAEVVDPLLAAGLPPQTPAAVISAAHTARQRHARCTLATLATTLAAEPGLCSPAVLVIGEVAALGVEQVAGHEEVDGVARDERVADTTERLEMGMPLQVSGPSAATSSAFRSEAWRRPAGRTVPAGAGPEPPGVRRPSA
ncbi:MAG: uroporphyrinogen-III C-methyltransferase [Lautropia sp.]